MKAVDSAVPGRQSFLVLELGGPKRRLGLRVGDLISTGRVGEGGELLELVAPSRRHELAKRGLMIGEVEEGRRCRELLSGEDQGRLRRQEQQRQRCTVLVQPDEVVQALSHGAVPDLVVVLEAEDEGVGRLVGHTRAARAIQVSRSLPLVEEPVLNRPDDVGQLAGVVLVVPVALAGQRRVHGVVKIVCPDGVESVSTTADWIDQSHVVAIALGDHDDSSAAGSLACYLGDLLEDVRLTRVEDRVRGVEPEAVDVILLDPLGDVLQDEVADEVTTRSVEVERLTPGRLVAVGEVVGREGTEVVAVGTEVVVDHVQDDAEAGAVGGVDEPS